jgi:hypothetical protein
MAQLVVFAEALAADDPNVRAFQSGELKQFPGMLLRDVLKHADAEWNTTVELNDRFREDIRRVALLTNDQRLLKLADTTSIPVSIDHLRSSDPDATWVALGARLLYTAEESQQLRQHRPPQASDPSSP